ncbi:cysteine-rich KTR domain-containing protein [Clostridia bacterium OttesenSCG-928-O13]|nr:cysteine-rich KTR domain-containing protein [Clostridia bacterium OttesenSCG-928-O13]
MVVDGWYHCPVCGAKVIPVRDSSIIAGTELYCKKCKMASVPLIIGGMAVDPMEYGITIDTPPLRAIIRKTK